MHLSDVLSPYKLSQWSFHLWYFFCSIMTSARRQWVREEDLARDLKKNPKQVRKILRHFEEQHLVTRYQRKEVCMCMQETIYALFQIGVYTAVLVILNLFFNRLKSARRYIMLQWLLPQLMAVQWTILSSTRNRIAVWIINM